MRLAIDDASELFDDFVVVHVTRIFLCQVYICIRDCHCIRFSVVELSVHFVAFGLKVIFVCLVARFVWQRSLVIR